MKKQEHHAAPQFLAAKRQSDPGSQSGSAVRNVQSPFLSPTHEATVVHPGEPFARASRVTTAFCAGVHGQSLFPWIPTGLDTGPLVATHWCPGSWGSWWRGNRFECGRD